MRRAKEAGLDLVEVSPKAQPPVAKIINYGAYLYRQQKAERKSKAKQKRVEIKGIRISFKMGEHDLENRIAQSRKFLDGGDKVKIELILRGREKAHVPLARQKITAFVQKLGMNVRVEQDVSFQGNRISMLIAKA